MKRELHLPPRQVEVCCLVAANHSDKVIGCELGISTETVRFHLKLSAKAITQYDRSLSGTPREVIMAWYRECRRLAFSRLPVGGSATPVHQ